MKIPHQSLERTSFQTIAPYTPELDVKSDVAIVYGFENFAKKKAQWQRRGYITHFMTGVAWGDYQEYLDARWDGKNHRDEAQVARDNQPIMHDGDVPYMMPSETYAEYLCKKIRKVIDAGAAAIHLEEPEFWVGGGYGESFKREWAAYYNMLWVPPHTSVDARYRASKLQYYLYRRALQQVFSYVADYSQKIGRHIRCYVPTHSMINYATWRIVSPEQSLVLLRGCDGYIGQVWTGTARTPNIYRGVKKERTFETAFFEYGSLFNLVRSTGRRMYYLNDPVEDDPNHTWEDYQRNWECTLVASLLWPEVWRYEVMPWPRRVFTGKFPVEGSPQRIGIPRKYATELMMVVNALNEMKQKEIAWESGTHGIGILISDTLMFQRAEPHESDGDLSSFYGLAMPLLKSGIPVHPVQLENIVLRDYLTRYTVLFLTYEGQKPPSEKLHDRLAKWVRDGGILVFVDDDGDPYNGVTEWWNSKRNSYACPRHHLFEKLGLSAQSKEGMHTVEKGAILYKKNSPAQLARRGDGTTTVKTLARTACRKAGVAWQETNYLLLRRGPYIIAAGLDESSVRGRKSLTGSFINLFDPKLSLQHKVNVTHSDRLLLLDLDRIKLSACCVLASASKVLNVKTTKHSIRFHSSGPAKTYAATRVALPTQPVSVTVEKSSIDEIAYDWDPKSRTLLLEYPNSPEGIEITIIF